MKRAVYGLACGLQWALDGAAWVAVCVAWSGAFSVATVYAAVRGVIDRLKEWSDD